MRNIFIGTIVVILGAIGFLAMIYCGVPVFTSKIISITVASIGFIIQIGSALLMRVKHNREIAETKNKHEAFLKEIQSLPPEKAIKRLLETY